MRKLRKRIIILGAGDQGQIINHILRLFGYQQIYFLDDHQKGSSILGKISTYAQFINSHTAFFVSFGKNALRRKWYLLLKKSRCRFVNAIHPTAHFEKGVTFGENIMAGAHVYVNIGTSIGHNVILNTGCIIEHDNVLAGHVQVCPGVITAGCVTIQEESFIGMGATIINGVTIARRTIVGAAANVIRNTLPHTTVVGNPAKVKAGKK